MAALTITDLRKSYGAVEVLKDITLEARAGEFIALVGPSGCGKSTLLAMIAGLESVTAGEIRIDGRLVNDEAPKDRDIAMVFQSYALYPTMTVRQNMTFGMESRRVPKAIQDEAVARVAALLQIEPLLNRRPAQLSGGQRQRVAMGRALVRDPKLFLFDEPLSNLDAKLRIEMRTEIKKLHQRVGKTTIYVTHDQIEAMTLASRIAVMHKGVLQQFDTPKVIYERPVNQFVAGFMGSPSMNFLPCVVDTNGTQNALVVTGAEAVRLALPATLQVGGHGRRVVFGVRPEHFSLAGSGRPMQDAGASVNALVEVVEPTGSETILMVKLSGHDVVVRCEPDAAPEPGTMVPLTIDMRKVSVFDAETEQRI
jgi:multiple sugar transport system ATP-binding protein